MPPTYVKELIRIVCKNYQIDEQAFIAQTKQQPAPEARAVAAYLVQDAQGVSLTELGQYVRRDLSALSRAASRLRARLQSDHELAGQVRRIEEGIRAK